MWGKEARVSEGKAPVTGFIRHLHISHNAPYLPPPPPPNCCISIVFNLSWSEKQSLCKVVGGEGGEGGRGGGGQIRCHYRRWPSGEWKLRYISNRKRFACLHSLRGAGSIRDRRETKSRVCITVEISLKPSSVYIRLCKYRKKVFYCFYKLISPQKKPAKLLVVALIKREILTRREVL